VLNTHLVWRRGLYRPPLEKCILAIFDNDFNDAKMYFARGLLLKMGPVSTSFTRGCNNGFHFCLHCYKRPTIALNSYNHCTLFINMCFILLRRSSPFFPLLSSARTLHYQTFLIQNVNARNFAK
jgi:hypothetical protein